MLTMLHTLSVRESFGCLRLLPALTSLHACIQILIRELRCSAIISAMLGLTIRELDFFEHCRLKLWKAGSAA